MAFGKFFLLPVLGGTLFGWLTYALKTAHNLAGPLFAVALVFFSINYLRDNLPRAGDMTWLLKGGGLFGGGHVPSHRFNAGEKIMYWIGGIVLGLVVVVSGLVLDLLVPGWGETRGQMQVAHLVHAIASVLMMALFLGHIYMATLGVPGAMEGHEDRLCGRVLGARNTTNSGTTTSRPARSRPCAPAPSHLR
jgi:formate dehydrogenase subunit gamma